MTGEQIFLLVLLVFLFLLFVKGWVRYDAAAFLALVLATLVGSVPSSSMFAGFGHPATVTVALVLVISRGFQNAGVVDMISRRVLPPFESTTVHVGVLASVGATLSAVMNNVGALALLLPTALQSAEKAKRSPGKILMPLSFGSILGGLVTLIGTPPNIIVSGFRAEALGTPFGMFDFTPVGGTVAVAGILFVTLLGWRLIPRRAEQGHKPGDRFQIEDYVGEACVPEGAKADGLTVQQLEEGLAESEALLIGLIRGRNRYDPPQPAEVLQAGDILVLQGGPDELTKTMAEFGLEAVGAEQARFTDQDGQHSSFGAPAATLAEVVIPNWSRIVGNTGASLRLRTRHGTSLLAVSRQGRPIRSRLSRVRFRAGDVLLLEGKEQRLPSVINALGCLPLADRGLAAAPASSTIWPAGIAVGGFGLAILLATVNLISLPLGLAAIATLMVLTRIVPIRDLYDGIDWPIIVLLGALIPIGGALQSSGTTDLIAGAILGLTDGMPAVVVLALVLIVTMTLSDVLNNAATAVIMAPIALTLAERLGVAPDAFLMAVAIGASAAFLTPIGHQNNTLVMGPGGYRFGDYWPLGLPLELLICAVAVPLLLVVWPL